MLIRDSGGPATEKHGNTAWVRCVACPTWFPVAPRMLDASAPACVCPACLAEFHPAAQGARDGNPQA